MKYLTIDICGAKTSTNIPGSLMYPNDFWSSFSAVIALNLWFVALGSSLGSSEGEFHHIWDEFL